MVGAGTHVVVCSATNDFTTVHVASSDNLFQGF